LEVVAVDRWRDRVAGLDVHRDVVVGCVRAVADGERTVAKQKFKTTSAGLAGLAGWLLDQRVELAVMEATGVYWKAPYYALEGVVPELWLVNARHVKNVPGRKTDLSDAEWLADVAAHGMVRPSLVPPPPIRELRELTRYRKTQVDERAKEIQRLEKVLQDAGIKLTSVASTVHSKSSVAMVEAMIAGERDPDVLAGLARGRMRARMPELSEALAGRFAAHHGVVARQILDHITFLDASIAELSAEVAARCVPFAKALDLLVSIPGISRLTAEVLIAETGGDMSRFRSAGHLGAGVAPANAESAGKRHAAGTRQGARWLRRALVESAKAASHGKDTYLAAQYRRIPRRRGPNKATVAVAHSIIVAAWHVLTNGQPYADPGGDYFERRESGEVRARRLVRQLEALGHQVTLTPAA
jgi:transposase